MMIKPEIHFPATWQIIAVLVVLSAAAIIVTKGQQLTTPFLSIPALF